MIINADKLILGRMSTFVAKQALLGETIEVINCEKAVVVGNPKNILAKFKQLRARGDPHHGPYYPKQPERIVKRAIRGMLPLSNTRGKEAFKRVKCFKGTPARFVGKESMSLENAKLSGDKLKYMSIERVVQIL